MTQTTENDDLELWRAVTDTVKPLSSKTPAKKAAHVSLRKKLTVDVKPVRHTPDFDYSVTEKLTEGDIHAMDKKTGQRFRNGEMPIEAVLDLHGYTLESGFDALVKFVYAQEKRGARCLLLITGKGGFLGRGVIRAEVPNWMNASEIRSLILSYCQAKPKDGGEGAFYILLKRRRS